MLTWHRWWYSKYCMGWILTINIYQIVFSQSNVGLQKHTGVIKTLCYALKASWHQQFKLHILHYLALSRQMPSSCLLQGSSDLAWTSCQWFSGESSSAPTNQIRSCSSSRANLNTSVANNIISSAFSFQTKMESTATSGQKCSFIPLGISFSNPLDRQDFLSDKPTTS